MITINKHYLKLQSSYLFSTIEKRVNEYQENNPGKEIIKLGIGDCTRALPEACIEAFHRAVDEMADDASFKGYGPQQGYPFLRETITLNDFNSRGADIHANKGHKGDKFILCSQSCSHTFKLGTPVNWRLGKLGTVNWEHHTSYLLTKH